MKRLYFLLVLIFPFYISSQVLTLLNKTNINCTNDLNGQATFSINGTAFPYDVTLQGCNTIFINGITTNTFTANGLGNCLQYMSISPNGEYTVTISDNTFNIVDVITFSMTSTNPYFLLQPSMYKNINCPNANNGYSQWQTVYGTGPFSYLWSTSTNTNYASGNTITNAAPGLYSITATDSYGCKQTWGISFTNPYIDIQAVNASMPACCNGTLNYSVVGIVPPPAFNYTVSPAITSNTTVCSGIYTITANSSTCTASATVNIGCSTDLPEITNSTRFNVYPNPVRNRLVIRHENRNFSNAVVVIYDLFGRETFRFDYSDVIDVSDLANGCYFIIVFDVSGNNLHSKFVKE